MCGIAAILGRWSEERRLAAIKQMRRALRHRGPDAEGGWSDRNARVELAHTRLAILDVSPQGAQPMVAASGQTVVVFNGELYNHQELRRALPDISFRGHSDTEALVETIHQRGFSKAVAASCGMFAIVCWDARLRRMWLARDRFGEKPLYWAVNDGAILIASEPQAILAGIEQKPRLNHDAIADLLHLDYIPAPRCIWAGIHKLPAAHLAWVDADAVDLTPQMRRYWYPPQHSLRLSSDEATERCASLLATVVRSAMDSDVAMGALLSGGVDSTAVVAEMVNAGRGQVRTFTAGFDNPRYDESAEAAAIASHLGTTHTVLPIRGTDAMAAVPRLAKVWQEPFADASMLPTLLISELTRGHVTVALTGDGGDELFLGYSRYRQRPSSLMLRALLPRSIRRKLAAWISPPMQWRQGSASTANLRNKREKLTSLLAAPSAEDALVVLQSRWHDISRIVPGAKAATPSWLPRSGWPEAQRAFDLGVYLPDDLLVKVDRAAMSVGLETRAPMLDHRFAEFALTLDPQLNLTPGRNKDILRKVAERYVPRTLLDRPKRGFAPPIGAWLRQELRTWADDLLSPLRLSRQGILAPEAVATIWAEHRSGVRNWEYKLWGVLMLQSWLDQQGL